MFASAFGDVYSLTETLVKATPLVFTGLAVAVAFRAKFWNIGARGPVARRGDARLLGRRPMFPGRSRSS